jgi:hypothetical protein
MRPIHIPCSPREQQLSATALSAAAESGAVARDLGFIPARQTTAPARREISPSSVLFVWPAPPRRA